MATYAHAPASTCRRHLGYSLPLGALPALLRLLLVATCGREPLALELLALELYTL